MMAIMPNRLEGNAVDANKLMEPMATAVGNRKDSNLKLQKSSNAITTATAILYAATSLAK